MGKSYALKLFVSGEGLHAMVAKVASDILISYLGSWSMSLANTVRPSFIMVRSHWVAGGDRAKELHKNEIEKSHDTCFSLILW